jgi:hypothetical protein
LLKLRQTTDQSIDFEDWHSAIAGSETTILPPGSHRSREVDELMALCDRLESALTTTQTETRRLLDAVLHQALAMTS